MSFKTGSNHIHLFKQGRVETECEGMKDARGEGETAVRGLMKEPAVFTRAVERRHGDRETMIEGPERIVRVKYWHLCINAVNSDQTEALTETVRYFILKQAHISC